MKVNDFQIGMPKNIEPVIISDPTKSENSGK